MQKMTNVFIVNISMRKMTLEVELTLKAWFMKLKNFSEEWLISSRDDPKKYILL